MFEYRSCQIFLNLHLFSQRRKVKPRDASNAHGATAAESVRNLIKKNPKYSKRINYDALKDLFVDSGDGVPNLDEKDDSQLYHFDDKDDEISAPMVIIEGDSEVAPIRQMVQEDDKDDEDEDEDAPRISWEDAFQQEV